MTKSQTTTSITLGVIAGIAFLGLASASLASAETYLYVNTSGQLASYEANTAQAAINQPTDIAYNSGVILVSEYEDLTDTDTTVTQNTGGENRYAYVSANGNLLYVMADSASAAINSATNIADNSGVIETSEFDDSGDLE